MEIDKGVHCGAAAESDPVPPKVLSPAGHAYPANILQRSVKRLRINGVVVHIAPLTRIQRHSNRDRLAVVRTEIVSAGVSPPTSVGSCEIVVLLFEENVNGRGEYVFGIHHFVSRPFAIDFEGHLDVVQSGSRIEWCLYVVNVA